jgi:hypothetical protein
MYRSDDLMPDLFAGPYVSSNRTSRSCSTTLPVDDPGPVVYLGRTL